MWEFVKIGFGLAIGWMLAVAVVAIIASIL